MKKSDRLATPETQDLLNEIEAAIGEIERGTGNQWHQGVGTWAAVAEMLARGPIMARAPKHIGKEDSELRLAVESMAAAVKRKDEIREGLKVFDGIVQVGLYSDVATMREAFASADLQEPFAIKAKELLDEMEACDQAYEVAVSRMDRVLEPIASAIEDGRKCYEQPQASLVLRSALGRLEAQKRWIVPMVAPAPFCLEQPAASFKPLGGPTLGSLLLRLANKGNDDAAIPA